MSGAAPSGKVAIVGASGRMGKLLLEQARAKGIDATALDRPYADENLAKACAEARLVILCVPAASLEEVILKLEPHLGKSAILADITSVKEAPMRQMEKHWAGPVVGTHPLFGPTAEPASDRPVAITPGAKAAPEDVAQVEQFFQAIGCRVFRTDAASHDKAMARIQNMNFITNLAYFAALADQEDLLPFLTPSFERRKQAAAKMLGEDAAMFAGLFEANSHSHEAVRQFRRILNLAASGEIDLLCQRARWWWQPERQER